MMQTRAKTQKKSFIDFNWIVLVVIVALIAIGLLNLRNADFYSEDSFHERQLKWYLIGMVLAVIVSVLDLHLTSRLSYVFYGLWIILLIAVLFTEPINNSRRWLTIPLIGVKLQPSEFAKLGVVLAVARWFHDAKKRERETSESHWLLRFLKPFIPFGIICLPVGLIFWEPDLGTAIIVMLIGLSAIFYQGVRWRAVITSIGLVALIFPLAWKFALHDYQKARVMVWWDAAALEQKVEEVQRRSREDHTLLPKLERLKKILAKAYQPEQAVKAIGSGEFYGKGGRMGHATRQRTLPYLHTDFVIATYGEERGFIGCTLLLLLYYVLVYWTLHVTRSARDKYQVLVAVGVCGTIFWQFFVNVGMVTGLLPVVGVALPLLSYGGSSVLSICIGLGLLFNIVLRQRATG